MATRTPTSPTDAPVNVALGIVVLMAILAGLLRVAGSMAAWITGRQQPSTGIASGVAVLLRPGDPAQALGSPGLSPVAYWITAGLLIAVTAVLAAALWRVGHAALSGVRDDAYRAPGTATRAQILNAASRRALMRRATHLRPSMRADGPADVGYRIGRARGVDVWASVEDSILVIGPPRSGKGAHIVINTILDAPGAVVTTSTRPDNIAATLRARQRVGPVAVFDPQHLTVGLPVGLRWSPIRGCESPLTAMIRATGLAAGTGMSAGGVDGGGFWEAKTRTALQALLHAAALDRRSPAELYRWTLDTAAAAEAVAILTSNAGAAAGWAESLQAMLESDPRTRDSIWQGVSLALNALADPRVLDAVSPNEDEAFDPELFLRRNGTVYLLATGAGASNSASLVSAFVEDLVETSRRLAAHSAGARLDPPVLLALDEIGNLAPLPSLPTLMAEGGGTGITTMPVLQSLAQARTRWGDNAANAMWDASIVKIVLGGGSNSRDLQDLSTLIGERDDITDSTTIGDRGARSSQRSIRRVPIMPPQRIRTLPFGTALILLRSAPPIVTRLRAWTQRPDAKAIRSDRSTVESTLRTAPREEPDLQPIAFETGG